MGTEANPPSLTKQGTWPKELVTYPPKREYPFKKGVVQNPSGGPVPVPYMQPPDQRAKIILAKYSPQQILAFAKNIKKAPLSTSDAIVVMHLAAILERDGLERERLYDRTFGKVADKQISLNLHIDTSPDKLSDKALSLLDRLTPSDDSDLIAE